MMAEAEAIASQLMTADHATRRNELAKLKSGDPALYAMVKQLLYEMEKDAENAGLEAARGGGQPPM